MTPSSSRNTVLLVDDDPDVLTSLGRILEQAKYPTVAAKTIHDALERDDWKQLLAVILDRRLPDGWIDGYLAQFRERDPDMAIIIVTGYSDLDGTVAALRQHVQDYLIKPINPDLLLDRLARIAETQEARESVRRLEQEVIHAADEEKRRFALEIHDGLGSKLGGIAMLCQGLERTLRYQGHEEEADRAREVDALIRETIADARRLSQGLHSVHGHPQGLLDALRNLADQVRRAWSVTCEFRCEPDFSLTDPIVANHLFRIAQEAVANAVRHGESTKIGIDLEDRGRELCLRITDNGKGFEPMKLRGRGMGLHSMEYRSRAIGGLLRVQAGEGKPGVQVVCRVPNPGLAGAR